MYAVFTKTDLFFALLRNKVKTVFVQITRNSLIINMLCNSLIIRHVPLPPHAQLIDNQSVTRFFRLLSLYKNTHETMDNKTNIQPVFVPIYRCMVSMQN
jgi:hypothetical protein